MHRLAVLAAVCLLVTAGCVGSASGPGADTTTDEPTDTTAEPTTTPASDPLGDVPTGERTFETTDCSDAIQWVSFYALNEVGRLGLWTQEHAAVGYTVHGNASVFLAAYANGTRLGVDHVSTVGYDHGVTADGDDVPFDRRLDGERAIRVVAHRDVDRDGEFDPDVDLACTDEDGDLVSTGVSTVDFGALDTETGTPSTNASTAPS